MGWAIGDIFGTVLLAGVLRLVISHHLTFCINSLAHIIGARPYTTENTARDNGVVALLTFGEGIIIFTTCSRTITGTACGGGNGILPNG